MSRDHSARAARRHLLTVRKGEGRVHGNPMIPNSYAEDRCDSTGLSRGLPLRDHRNATPHVLYVNWVHGEDGGAVHVREAAAGLEGLGCTVRVVWHHGAPETIGVAPQAYSRRPQFLAWLLHEPKELVSTLLALFREIGEAWRFRPDWMICRYKPGKWSSILTSRILRIPILLEVNALYEEENIVYRPHYLHYRRLMGWVERLVVRASHGVMVISTPLQESLCRRYDLPHEDVLVNPNGGVVADGRVTESRAAVRSRLGLGSVPVIVFAGSFQRFHGTELLATVAARILEDGDDVAFLILGEGPERTHLEEVRSRYPCRVLLPGQLPYSEARNILGACDIGVLPDCLPYGSPLKLMEYAAAGLGIVAPDYPAVREVLSHADSAMLFPPHDKDALLKGIRDLVDDGQLRERLGKAARERVLGHFTWRHNATRLLEFAERRIHRRSLGWSA